MQRSLLSLFLITVIVTGIVSCNHTDKSGIVVPKDAALAVHINAPSLTSKVSWQEIQQNEWFKKLYAEETDSLSKQLLDDPSNSGIDIKSDMAFFIKKQGQGSYIAFEGTVKNATAFEAFVKKLNKGGNVSKNGDISVLPSGVKTIITWNNNRFVFVSDFSFGGMAGRLSSSNSIVEPFAFHTDSLQKFAIQLFDLPHKENLLSDDRFASLMKEPGDIHYWVNAEQYYNALGGALSLLKLNVLFEGNAYATSLNFDNGKITLKSKGYYNKELRSLIDKYSSSSISADMLNRIPSQNVVAVFAAKYPPEGFRDLIKLVGVDGFVNSFFSSVGYSTDEFVKATKGDVLLSVSDFSLGAHKTTITGPNGESIPMDQPSVPDAKVLFATSVNDKPSFDKLFGILQSKIQEAPEVASKIHFQLNNNWFAASNAPEQVNGFLAGGNNHFPFTERLSGHAFGGYINVQQILKSVAPTITDSSSKAAMDLSVNMWQDIIMTSGGEKSGAYTGEAEINLVDKNTNSLKQLNKYLDGISRLSMHKQGEYNAQINYSDPAALSFAALAPLAH
jgi:hypothetical protein